MKHKNPLWIILFVTMLAIAACTAAPAEPGAAPEATDTAEPAPTPTEEVAEAETETPEADYPEAVVAARETLATRQTLDPATIEIESYEEAEWPNACLGLAEAGEMCAEVITPGYMVILRDGDTVYEARTDQSGNTVRFVETADPATEYPAAVITARQYLADQLGVEPATIEIISFERREWTDSCLGLGGPAESCLQVITPGWMVMLGYEGQAYEVHTDEMANAIRTAGNVSPVVDKPAGDPQILFRRSGGIAGDVVEYRIYESGMVELLRNPEMPNGTAEMFNIPPEAVDLLVSSLEEAGFFETGNASYVPEDDCCDRYLYELSVRQENGETTTIEVLEANPDTPAAVQQIIDVMQQFVEQELNTQ